MLSNITSKIILAFIAIFLVYTFAPIIKSMIDGIFFKKKGKSLSQSDFDEMVNRKMQQLSGSKNTQNQLPTDNIHRPKDSPLYKNKVFKDDKQLKLFLKLKKELQWGTGDYEVNIQNKLLKYGVDAEVTLITNFLKKVTREEFLIDKFKKKKIELDQLYDYVALQLIIKNIFEFNDNISLNIFNLDINLTRKIAYITLLNGTKPIERLVKSFVKDEIDISIDEALSSHLFLSFKEFKNQCEKTINMIDALIPRDENYFLVQFNSVDDNKEKHKSLYKKLVQHHHPDKWSHLNKTDEITKRLNENFHNLKSAYDQSKV